LKFQNDIVTIDVKQLSVNLENDIMKKSVTKGIQNNKVITIKDTTELTMNYTPLK
jgi:hypothetical protein